MSTQTLSGYLSALDKGGVRPNLFEVQCGSSSAGGQLDSKALIFLIE
jgi:hypothetical protein